MKKVRVGISSGDINGVGLEVIIKSLEDDRILEYCVPVIYGSSKVVSYHKNIVKPSNFSFQSISSANQLDEERINIVNCWTDDITITLGTPNEDSGKFAYTALDSAVNDLKSGLIDVLVTGPIDKHAMSTAGFSYPGHTEYLSAQFQPSKSLMLMVADRLRIGVVTNHLPISEVAGQITKQRVIEKIFALNKALKEDFGIEKPTIAVMGLNPHAGDNGLLGREEDAEIRPAVIECKKKGILAVGPYSADGFFGSGQYREVDAVLAMYHDQGLIPFKLLSFGNGVNFTAGLSVVRTSPDHGTGAIIAGKNQASPSSFRSAIYAAMDIFRNRKRYAQELANPIKKQALVEEDPDAVDEESFEGEK